MRCSVLDVGTKQRCILCSMHGHACIQLLHGQDVKLWMSCRHSMNRMLVTTPRSSCVGVRLSLREWKLQSLKADPDSSYYPPAYPRRGAVGQHKRPPGAHQQWRQSIGRYHSCQCFWPLQYCCRIWRQAPAPARACFPLAGAPGDMKRHQKGPGQLQLLQHPSVHRLPAGPPCTGHTSISQTHQQVMPHRLGDSNSWLRSSCKAHPCILASPATTSRMTCSPCARSSLAQDWK